MTTSYVNDLFVNRAIATAADVQDKAPMIVNECRLLFTRVQDAHNAAGGKAGTDAIRDAVLAADNEGNESPFWYLYPDTGKPNKKGETKPVRSPLTDHVYRGMMFLGDPAILEHSENTAAELFEQACEAGTIAKRGAIDLGNIKRTIKPKAPKSEGGSGGSGEGGEGNEGEGEGNAAENAEITKPSLDDIAKELIERLGKKEANKLSIMLADLTDGGDRKSVVEGRV